MRSALRDGGVCKVTSVKGIAVGEKCGGVGVGMTDAQALEWLQGHWQEGRGTEAWNTATLEGTLPGLLCS